MYPYYSVYTASYHIGYPLGMDGESLDNKNNKCGNMGNTTEDIFPAGTG
jgi:hypothetical protein